MKKALIVSLGVAVLAGCVDTSTRQAQTRMDDSPQSGPAASYEVGDPVAGSPVEVQVFEESRDERDRLMVRMLVRADADRAALRATLDSITTARRESDPGLSAIRTVGYIGVVNSPEAIEANLRPIAWGEWVPAGGWEAVQAGRDLPHRFYFYYRIQPEW